MTALYRFSVFVDLWNPTINVKVYPTKVSLSTERLRATSLATHLLPRSGYEDYEAIEEDFLLHSEESLQQKQTSSAAHGIDVSVSDIVEVCVVTSRDMHASVFLNGQMALFGTGKYRYKTYLAQ